MAKQSKKDKKRAQRALEKRRAYELKKSKEQAAKNKALAANKTKSNEAQSNQNRAEPEAKRQAAAAGSLSSLIKKALANPIYIAAALSVIIIAALFIRRGSGAAQTAQNKEAEEVRNNQATTNNAILNEEAENSSDDESEASESESAEAESEAAEEAEKADEENFDEAGSNTAAEGNTDENAVDREDILAAKRIYRFLEEADKDGAALFIIENSKLLETLFTRKLNGELYIFDGDNFQKLGNERVKGLVLKNSNTVFFGEFENQMPSGEVLAIKAYNADSCRYDYASGNWVEGRLEGDGNAGFGYPKRDVETVNVSRQGYFMSNLMEGSVKYITENADQSLTEWNFNVIEGKIVLDDSWRYDAKTGVYKLNAVDNKNTYELKESEMENQRLKNNVIWSTEQ